MISLSRRIPKGCIDLRQRVILQNVWKLSEAEAGQLDSNATYSVAAKQLSRFINTKHPFKDFLDFGGHEYQVFYVNGSCTLLDDAMTETVLVTFRRNYSSKFSACLILFQPSPEAVGKAAFLPGQRA